MSPACDGQTEVNILERSGRRKRKAGELPLETFWYAHALKLWVMLRLGDGGMGLLRGG